MLIRNALFVGFLGLFATTSHAASANTVSTADFVRKASIANEFEIESSKMALDKSQNEEVRNFAQRMIDDHTQTGEKMEETLKDANTKAQPAAELDNKHQKLIASLDNVSGEAFDRKYISMQTDAHKEAVGLFSTYAKSGKNSALKNFASETLPDLKEHLNHVKELHTQQ